MADGVKVDALIIDVEVNAKGARKEIDDLSSSVKKLGGVATQADLQKLKGKMSDLRSSLRGISADQNSFTAALKSSFSGLSNLWNKVIRVISYRLIRTAIKEVTDGLKTGIENVYNFSQLTGGSFSESLDRASTQLLYMKNAIGTALAPVIEALVPILVRVTDFIGTLADKASEFFAAWNGEALYTSARKTAQTWGEGAESLEKAAKATRFLISGFDELNKIPSKSEGSALGKSAVDYSAMFEYKPVDSGFAAVVGDIKTALTAIVKVLKPYEFVIGAVLLLSGHPIIGLGLMIYSALNFYKEQKQNSDNGTAASILTTEGLKQVADALAPVAFIIGAIFLFSGNIPVGLGLMAGSLALKFFGMSENSGDDGKSITEKLKDTVSALCGDLKKYKYFMYAAGAVFLFTGNIGAGLGLFALPTVIEVITDGKKGEFSIKTLYSTFTDEIKGLMEMLKDYGQWMYLGAAILLFTGHIFSGLALFALPSVIEVMTNGEKKEFSISGIKLQLTRIAENLAPILLAVGGIATVLGIALMFVPGGINVGLKLLVGGVASFVTGLGFAEYELQKKIENAFVITGKILLGAAFLVSMGTGNVVLAGALVYAAYKMGVFSGYTDSEPTGKLYSGSLIPNWEYAVATNKIQQKTLSGALVPGRASGGFVDTGDLFFANENGPEYVASIGNRTAVANNDQIVAGISTGVAVALSAYVPAIITAIEENRTQVAIGDEQIAKSASNGNAAFRRMTGRSLPGLA